jgi:hypothetical protein
VIDVASGVRSDEFGGAGEGEGNRCGAVGDGVRDAVSKCGGDIEDVIPFGSEKLRQVLGGMASFREREIRHDPGAKGDEIEARRFAGCLEPVASNDFAVSLADGLQFAGSVRDLPYKRARVGVALLNPEGYAALEKLGFFCVSVDFDSFGVGSSVDGYPIVEEGFLVSIRGNSFVARIGSAALRRGYAADDVNIGPG